MTVMEEAFATAAPVHTPRLTHITRTISGLRFWVQGTELTGRKFRLIVEDERVVLMESATGARAANRGRQCEICYQDRGGEPYRIDGLLVQPSHTQGKLLYPIAKRIFGANLPGEPVIRARPAARPASTPDAVPPALPAGAVIQAKAARWSDDRIRAVLRSVREIEDESRYRVTHDPKTGLAIFLARLEI